MTHFRLVIAAAAAVALVEAAPASAAPFRVFMISSTAVDHLEMSAAARVALPEMGLENDFTVDATTDNTLINEANLADYDVFLQMHLAPFEIEAEQRAVLENFVLQGKGWVGVHGAGLIIPGAYEGRGLPPTWDFYANLIGQVTYDTHPALQTGTVVMEDRTHPATQNLPETFEILDEWYEFSGNPRPNVRVLATADESTYNQVTPQGDHPMIWTYEGYPKVIYTAVGHHASDWENEAFTTLIRDSLLWAAGRFDEPVDGGVPPGEAGSGGNAGAGGSSGAEGSDAGSGGGGVATAAGAAGEPQGGAGTAGEGCGQAGGGTGPEVTDGNGAAGGAAMSERSQKSSSCHLPPTTRGPSSPLTSVAILIGLALMVRRR